MARTTYAPVAPYAQGYSVHPYANTLTREPHQDTGAMAPAGQLWSTTADLARYLQFLLGGDDRVLAGGMRAMTAAAHDPDDPQAAEGLGLRLLAGKRGPLVGHTGSMPGFQASLFVDEAQAAGAVVLANSTTGLLTDSIAPQLLDILEGAGPTAESAPEPWRPVTHVPTAVSEILGVWHWGNTGYVFTWNGREVVTSTLRTGDERETFVMRDDGFVGTSGYHHGERLAVVRNDDGSINHLVAATFVYTRTPYDPNAPIPGGLLHTDQRESRNLDP